MNPVGKILFVFCKYYIMVVVSSLTISRLSSQGSGISIAHACGEKERKGRNGKKKKHKYKVVANFQDHFEGYVLKHIFDALVTYELKQLLRT